MKKKHFAPVLAFVFIVFMLTGCEGFLRMDRWKDSVVTDSMGVEATETKVPDAAEGEATIQADISQKPDEATAEPLTGKNVQFEIKNVSGAPYVMDNSFELDYFDDLDAITVADFTVSAGSSMGFSSTAEVMADYVFTETSPTTYQLTIVCVAGALPTEEGESYVYLEDALVSTLTISGTYNELAVIEYDGTSFRQVG